MNTDYFINIRQLYYFISVAEHLNFTKAAEENHIAQTAMSQNIIALEKQLNVRLFERTKRKVVLTNAGKQFYASLKPILEELELSIAMTQRAEKGFEGSLRIGFQGIHEKEVLPKVLRIFQSRYPEIDITLVQDSLQHLEKQLKEQKLDLIFTFSSELPSDSNTCEYVYSHEPIYAVVPENHYLSTRKKVKRKMFADEPVIFIKPENGSGTYEAMLRDCRKAGFTPNIAAYTETVDSALMLVDAGIGVTFFPKCCQGVSHNIVFIELEDDGMVDLCVRWRNDKTNSSVPLFVDILKQLQGTKQ